MMEPSFERLLALLTEAGIRFVVVGGVAVTLHGYVRLTEDVDILIENTAENVAHLLATLGSYGEGFANELSPEDFTDAEGALRIVEETEQMQLDIFTRMSGKSYADVIGDAVRFPIESHQVAAASKRALIGWKGQSHREKDRLDAMALRQLEVDPEAFN